MIRRLVPKQLKKAIRNRFLRGNNVECVICNKTFITFLPFGTPPYPMRANARCPNCNSLERTRIIWKYLASQSDFMDKPKHVLHVAPETKLFEKFSVNPMIDYIPIDKFTQGYRYPKGTIDMDITALAYPENTFDFILCSHVLEHIPNDILAMQELHRVLKPGGWGILQVPIDLNRESTYEDPSITAPEERRKAFGQFDHVRVYGKDYIDRLNSVGFTVELDDFSVQMSKADKFRFGFGSGQTLFIVKKLPQS